MLAVFILTIAFHHVTAMAQFINNTSLLPAATNDKDIEASYQRFWDAFIFPGNLAQLQAVNSSLFAEDVVGRVDISRTFFGRELNTEYIFGTFSDTSFNPDVHFLLGAPLAHQTLHFATHGRLVSSSELVFFNTTTSGVVVPVELSLWVLFNQQGEIEQYDLTFRWFNWLFENMVSSLELETLSNTNDTLSLTLAREVCQTATNYCTGWIEQYSDYYQCQNFLINEVRLGAPHEFGRNTLLCRFLHAKILPLRPELHCAHIGPSGGDMCVDDLSYQEVVFQPAFSTDPMEIYNTSNCNSLRRH